MEEPQLSFRVSDEYEGPLDLILALITKHQVNIWDIEITSLLEQYMAYIRARQEQDLEVASEFLEMASRLVYIKTVSLLPKYEDEEEKAKAELVGQGRRRPFGGPGPGGVWRLPPAAGGYPHRPHLPAPARPLPFGPQLLGGHGPGKAPPPPPGGGLHPPGGGPGGKRQLPHRPHPAPPVQKGGYEPPRPLPPVPLPQRGGSHLYGGTGADEG